MPASLDIDRLKQLAMAGWRRGGLDTLVKVMPRATRPDIGRPIGFCTTFKFVAGRTPRQMEALLGFRSGARLASGAGIYLVRPLPMASQFQLASYSNQPGGVATDHPDYRAHHDYPPGLGVPQWNLDGLSQNALQFLLSLGPDEPLAYRAALLPAPI